MHRQRGGDLDSLISGFRTEGQARGDSFTKLQPGRTDGPRERCKRGRLGDRPRAPHDAKLPTLLGRATNGRGKRRNGKSAVEQEGYALRLHCSAMVNSLAESVRLSEACWLFTAHQATIEIHETGYQGSRRTQNLSAL